MMKPPKLLDNKKSGRVIDELKDNIKTHNKLSIISAYFTIYAFENLKTEMYKIDDFRFIFTEPSYVTTNRENRQYYIDKNISISGNEFEIKLKNEIKQSSIAKECSAWVEKKCTFKSYKATNSAQQRLIYVDGKDSMCINGTVDFSTDGLGISPSNRLDANICLYGNEYTKSFLLNFDELWNDKEKLEDVTDKLLEDLHSLFKENTPETIYYLTLYNVFYNYLDELTEDKIIKSRTGIKDTKVWNLLYQFQKDGVIGVLDKIEKYGGCILADSVGLGKTFSALAIIKYYELRNDRILVLAPKKLKENWTIYRQNDKRNILADDRFNYDVLNHTDLSRVSGTSGDIELASLNWGNYDLIVIDESHNFRNNSSVKGHITRYQRLMNDIIKAGVKTKVLMLSATPVNNRMNDIKNQIAFITEGDDNALKHIGIDDISITLRNAQLTYNKWSTFSEEKRTTKNFVEMMDLEYFKLLDTLTIARSRKHIEKYYGTDEMGEFPKRLKPKNIYSSIDITKEFPKIEDVNKLIKKLTLALYSPLSYVLPEKRKLYEEKYDISVKNGQSVFKQVDRERSLINLMRVNILKRLESSVNSFTITVNRLLNKINLTLDQINNNEVQFNSDLNIFDIDTDDNTFEEYLTGSKTKVLFQDMDLLKWRQDLELDRDKLEKLLFSARKVTSEKDEKLFDLKELINSKEANPINNGNKKIIIFTTFADTAKYLYENLANELEQKGLYTALVTGSGENKSTLPIPKNKRKEVKIRDLNTVLTLFSPNSKSCNQVFPFMENYIDIIIATDCISEGQNLQDCDYLINYDIHWNPVRIIQRFGRIDRIGSINKVVQLVNFWPMADLDEYINLVQRVQGKMVLLDVSATGEENLIDTNNSKELLNLQYRKKQLEQLQSEVVDLEALDNGISILDLTFSDFKIDLMEYLKHHKNELENYPYGLYSIVKIDDSLKEEVEPGVIFTLKQVEGKLTSKDQNALAPYYLVYITESLEIKLSFLNSKTILDHLKKLCLGQNKVLKNLVDEFNKNTNNGCDMTEYTVMLKKVIENIVGKKEKAGLDSLFSKGGTSLDVMDYESLESFELVNFLILKD